MRVEGEQSGKTVRSLVEEIQVLFTGIGFNYGG